LDCTQLAKANSTLSLGIAALGVIALIIIVGFAVYLNASYNVASTFADETDTITSTSNSSFSLFSQLTTFTTVTRTTLSFGGSAYATTTGEYSGCIPPVQCYPTTVTTEIYRSDSRNTTHNASESSQQTTSLDTTFTTNFYYWITVNYSGSWRLVYWGWNGTLIGQISCDNSITWFCLTP